MKHVTVACAALFVALSVAPSPAHAQASNQPRGQQAMSDSEEIYNVRFVKAAPGKLRELIDAAVNAPADPNASAPPLILRHVDGDDWDLLVLTPLGKESKLTVAAPSASEQAFIQRMRALSAMHSDTFATGPAWSGTRVALAGPKSDNQVAATSGASQDSDVYIVTTYRALPGQRDQLQQVLRKITALDRGHAVTLQHMEGAPWDFVVVTRYDSWAALADNEAQPNMQQLRAQGFTSADGPGLALREHMAEHRDTIAKRVEGSMK